MKMRIKICIFLVNRYIKKKKLNHYLLIIGFLKKFSKEKKFNSSFIGKIFKRTDLELETSIISRQCLKRALSIKLILLTYGINTDLKIGVKINPFEAHAWVEKNCIPLYENNGKITEYSIILNE